MQGEVFVILPVVLCCQCLSLCGVCLLVVLAYKGVTTITIVGNNLSYIHSFGKILMCICYVKQVYHSLYIKEVKGLHGCGEVGGPATALAAQV